MKGKQRLAFALFLIGVGILLYPGIRWAICSRETQWNLALLETSLTFTDIEEQRRMAQQYNQDGIGTYAEILDIKDGMMGILSIPKIDVTLPIYHGTDEAVLRKGVGHLPESDLPIGGAGSHCVLTGHTGLPGTPLLTDLSELEIGDRFCLSVLGSDLEYVVDQITVVEPDDLSQLTADVGKDYCTLVTCTPYGVNSHRLLVRGCRVEQAAQPSAGGWSDTRQEMGQYLTRLLILAVTIPLSIAALLLTAMDIRRNKTVL